MKDSPKPLLSHLRDARRTLLGMFVAWFIATCAVIPFSPALFRWLQAPLANMRDPLALVPFHPTASLSVVITVVVYGGIILAMPFWIFFAAQFVFPALRRQERHAVVGLLGGAGCLFILGVFGGAFFIVPAALIALQEISRWIGVATPFWDIIGYTRLIARLLLACGLAMELPLVVFILLMLRVITVRQLRHYRRHAIIAILVIAMILTPPDPLTQLLMAIPLYALYEVCILLGSLFQETK